VCKHGALLKLLSQLFKVRIRLQGIRPHPFVDFLLWALLEEVEAYWDNGGIEEFHLQNMIQKEETAYQDQ
jgi:hypothetical protein